MNLEITHSVNFSSFSILSFSKNLKVRGQSPPAKATIRKYLTALATYSLPNTNSRGALVPSLIRRTTAMPTINLIA